MGDIDIVALGRRVQRYRKDQGLTQAELAKRAFVSRSFISLVETAKTTVSLHSLFAIAKALGVGVNDLMPGADDIDLSDPLVQVSAANAHLLSPQQKKAFAELIRATARGETQGG